MDVLLTFTGFHDPYFKGLVDQEEQPGPILSLLSTRSFDHIFLFGFVTRMYARFSVMADQPCSDIDSGCSFQGYGIHRLYG